MKDKQKGVWRTICGRRVFIADGQSLHEAMQASGKFGKDIRSASVESGKKKMPMKKIVKVNMDADIQKQFSNALPKERSKIAYRYIMNNLRGKYAAMDGREITISGVGADKMSHTTNETKIRVLPELARLIESGEFEGIVEAKKEGGQPHKLFTHFAYYKVAFQIGDDRYVGRLNVGIRKDGNSTLYDINPFNKAIKKRYPSRPRAPLRQARLGRVKSITSLLLYTNAKKCQYFLDNEKVIPPAPGCPTSAGAPRQG